MSIRNSGSARHSDIGCYGGEINTPNLDRLAGEGVRFRQFYNNSKCTTTRTSIMSGCYPWREGKQSYNFWDDQTYCIAQAMKDAGYQACQIGKWHVGPGSPDAWGFDDYFGKVFPCSYFDPMYHPDYCRPFMHNGVQITEFPDDFYATDYLTDYAVEQIKKAALDNKPYFMYLAYSAPHWPLQAKPEDIAKYDGVYDDGWHAIRQARFEKMKRIGAIGPDVKLSPPNPRTKEWTGDPEQILRIQVHAGMVDCIDQNIGKIPQVMDDTGTADNTLIVFLSDNGCSAEKYTKYDDPNAVTGTKESFRCLEHSWANASNTPFREYKLYCREGGPRTACVVRWPKGITNTGGWTDGVGHIIDLQPTFMYAAGRDPVADPPTGKRPLEGKDILPIFRGEIFDRGEPLYWEWLGSKAIRDGDWKAVQLVSMNSYRWELYNVAEDPTETNDLADQCPDKLQQMRVDWARWADEHGAPLERDVVDDKPMVRFNLNMQFQKHRIDNDKAFKFDVNYNAGRGHTVMAGDWNGVTCRLIERDASGAVVREYTASDPSTVGTCAGAAKLALDVIGKAPTADLPTGHYYTLEPVFRSTFDETQDVVLSKPVTGVNIRDKINPLETINHQPEK